MSITRRPPIETPIHKFAVGDKVRMTNVGESRLIKEAIFEIVAALPLSGRSYQYRIRDLNELHERVTTEDNLHLIGIWSNSDQRKF